MSDPRNEVFETVMVMAEKMADAGVRHFMLRLRLPDFARFLWTAHKLKLYETPMAPQWLVVPPPLFVPGFDKARLGSERVPVPVGGVFHDHGLTVGAVESIREDACPRCAGRGDPEHQGACGECGK